MQQMRLKLLLFFSIVFWCMLVNWQHMFFFEIFFLWLDALVFLGELYNCSFIAFNFCLVISFRFLFFGKYLRIIPFKFSTPPFSCELYGCVFMSFKVPTNKFCSTDSNFKSRFLSNFVAFYFFAPQKNNIIAKISYWQIHVIIMI